VRNIEETNELDLLMNVHRYMEITGQPTEHTEQFTTFLFIARPQYFESAAVHSVIEDARRELEMLDRQSVIAAYRQLLAANAKFQHERRHDLRDLGSVQPLHAFTVEPGGR
jgi:hypothetical protein